VCAFFYAPPPLLLPRVLQVRPLEDQFKFGSFFTPLLHESDFEAKPSVLLLGQYSTGKVCGGRQLWQQRNAGAVVATATVLRTTVQPACVCHSGGLLLPNMATVVVQRSQFALEVKLLAVLLSPEE
jgi:hypothetical protein